MVAFDFSTGALVFVVSLVAVPRTRRYCFKASVHSVPIFKTFLAAQWSILLFASFVFVCSPGIFMNLGGYFSLKVSRSGVEVIFLVFI